MNPYSNTEIRVAEYSLRMKEVADVVGKGREALAALRGQLENIGRLEQYYAKEWKSDFEADERGEICRDIDRGVLSEDALYNLLDDIHELRDEFRGWAESIRV